MSTKRNKGVGGHQSANITTNEWLTPPEVLAKLGPFDLDPCSPVNRPWDTAKTHYTILDNGLVKPWFGRVWLNPPYGDLMTAWLKLMSEHGNGLTLIFNRSDRNDVHDYCLAKADSMLLVRQRFTFYRTDGTLADSNGGAPNVFFSYGEMNAQALEECGIKGRHIPLNTTRVIVIGMTRSWRTVISVAFSKIDGEASLTAIYQVVEKIAPEKVSGNKHYREKIRQIVQNDYGRVKKGVYTINLKANESTSTSQAVQCSLVLRED